MSARNPIVLLPEPEPTGAILWLWVTAAVLGNVFAVYWLVRALLAQYPGRIQLARFWKRGKTPGDVKPIDGSPAATVINVEAKPQVSRMDRMAVLEWRDLCYSVRAGKGQDKPKALLQGIWGSLHSGELLALMGPSGAGKSTLLELLAMRRVAPPSPASPSSPGSAVEGGGGASQAAQRGVLLNGAPADPKHIKSISSYVPQDDILLPQMTVWEVLTLHAALRLPHGTAQAERADRQRDVMGAMGLSQQKDTLVGGVLPGGILLRGLSGGERKRLAIGAALLPSPMFLFADEPTSGLDAFAAMTVMAHLADQAHGALRCAVLVSIHQPRASIWDLMDKVLLLSRGHMVYEGSTSGLLPWLSDSLPRLLGPPYQPQAPPFEFDPEHHGTLADWAMDLVCKTDAQLAAAAGGSAVDQDSMPASVPALIDSGSSIASASPALDQAHPSVDGHQDRNSKATWITRAADFFLARYLESADGKPQTGLAAHVANGRAAEAVDGVGGVKRDVVVVAGTALGDALGAAGGAEGVGEPGADPGRHPTPHGAAMALASSGAGTSTAAAADGGQASAGPCDAVCSPELNSASHQAHGTLAAGQDAEGKRSFWAPAQEWWAVYKVLVWREMLAAVRNPADVAGRMLTFVWVSMLGNFLLYGGGSERDTAGSIRVRVAWLYFMLFFFMVMPFLFMSVFTADKRFYMADVTSRLYRPGPYYVAKLTASLPLNVMISLLFILIEYGMFGNRHTALAVVQVSVLSCLFSLISLQWMFFASAVAPSQDIAFVLAVAFAVVNLLIHSFFMGPEDLSGLPWMRKLRYISAMDMAWQGAVTAELKDRTFDCSGGGDGIGVDALGLFPQFIPNTTTFRPLRAGLETPGKTCLATGNAVLRYYDVTANVGMHVGELVLYLLVIHIATYVAVRVATYRVTRATHGGGHVAGG